MDTSILEAISLAQQNPVAAWDIGTFLENAQSTIKGWGGGLLTLLGIVGLIWGGVLLIKKLMANPQTAGQQSGWGTIALLIIVGGALSATGFSLISSIGEGGKTTIEDLGNGTGTVIAQHLVDVVSVLPF
ncbi:hypothetical protein [Brevibacterium oceani]|uniref:hypothetical protein n=1 Tax=Brevibacterium oceani TaxID=358099 RepID=UPI0015E74E59|nr:hypothetical protein [Brevibacterium oceani]